MTRHIPLFDEFLNELYCLQADVWITGLNIHIRIGRQSIYKLPIDTVVIVGTPVGRW